MKNKESDCPFLVLQVTAEPIWRCTNGGEQRAWALRQAFLDLGAEVRILYDGVLTERELEWLSRDGIGVAAIAAGLWDRPLPVEREPVLEEFRCEGTAARFKEMIRDFQPDLVLFEYVKVVWLLESLSPRERRSVKAVLDSNDVLHTRCADFHRAGVRHWIDIDKEQESGELQMVDVVLAIQGSDARVFRKMAPEVEVMVARHGVDPVRILSDPPQEPPVQIGYLAAAGYASQDALDHFLESVWPALFDRYGRRIVLNVAGRISDVSEKLAALPGVKVLGQQDDLSRFYVSQHVLVNPVRFGGGLKIKNVEILAAGRPLLTTPEGALGLEDGVGEAFLVAANPAEWIDRLGAWIEDPAARIIQGRRALEYAGRSLSTAALRQALEPLLVR